VIRRKRYFPPDHFGSGDKPFFGGDVASFRFRWKGKIGARTGFSNSPAVGGETSCDSDGVIVSLLVQGHLVPVEKWQPIQRKVVL
jgi:hypothetical protein